MLYMCPVASKTCMHLHVTNALQQVQYKSLHVLHTVKASVNCRPADDPSPDLCWGLRDWGHYVDT